MFFYYGKICHQQHSPEVGLRSPDDRLHHLHCGHADYLTVHVGFQRCWFFGQSPSTERRAETLRRQQASCRMEASQNPEARCLLSPPARPALCRYDAASLFCCATGQLERPQPWQIEALQDGKPCQLVTPNRTLKMPGRWVMKACVLRVKTYDAWAHAYIWGHRIVFQRGNAQSLPILT